MKTIKSNLQNPIDGFIRFKNQWDNGAQFLTFTNDHDINQAVNRFMSRFDVDPKLTVIFELSKIPTIFVGPVPVDQPDRQDRQENARTTDWTNNPDPLRLDRLDGLDNEAQTNQQLQFAF